MPAPNLLIRAAAALLAGLAAVAPATAQSPSSPPARERAAPEVGQPYGRLHLPTVDGLQTRTLAGLRGQPVLLVEFASW